MQKERKEKRELEAKHYLLKTYKDEAYKIRLHPSLILVQSTYKQFYFLLNIVSTF